MGRNSGGVVNIGQPTQMGIKVKKAVDESKPISSLSERAMQKELFRGISRYHAKLGVKERSVRVADLTGMGALGVTYIASDGKSTGILLNSKFFDRKKQTVEADVRKNHYDTGFKNRTNAPLQHTITHELAHATWNASMTSANARAAGTEIRNMYQKWMKDRKKKGYGSYAKTSVSEFWAEAVTKAVHGNSDKYTRGVLKIVKKYKL